MNRFRLLGRWMLVLAGLGGAAHAALPSRELDAIPLHLVPAAALDPIRTALPPAPAHGPVRLAVRVPMSLSLADGAWSLDGAQATWRARIQSPGATLLIAAFDRLQLPEGAELRFSDITGTTVQGPYTARDVVDGRLWTAMVPGDAALLELRLPATRRDQVDLHLAGIGHGEYGLRNDGVQPKSGACNVDVVCPAGDGWRDAIRAVVRLQIPSTANTVLLCTAQLINNTAQDDTPYVLTANHCGIDAASAGGVVAYFNFQTSSCNATPDGSLTQNQSGAALVFAHARSDHALLRLNAAPDPAFNAYLTGFDANAGATPAAGVAIHHPSGDEKRISTFDAPASRADGVCLGTAVLGNCSGTVIDTYRVRWSSGITEQGSSGAGLLNPDRRLVGVLSGGNTSCSNPGGDDYFGRLDLAWSSGINTYLDPGGRGSRSVGGKNIGGAPSLGGGSAGGGLVSGGGGGGGGSFGAAFGLLAAALLRRVISARRACRAAAAA